MNKLLLLSGNDLPFIGGQGIIHQPKLKEIAYLGENTFYLGSNFLCFSKDKLEEKDKINLQNQNDFNILMSMINIKAKQIQSSVNSAELVLSLIFPGYQLKKMPNLLLLTRTEQDGSKQQCIINQDNFNQFKNIITQMFCLSGLDGSNKYKPANKLAEQIAKKLEQRHKKLNQKKGTGQDIDILSRYISILTLANHHTIPQLMEYTVYQLFNEFQRFEKKYAYDSWFSAKLAGAEGLQDVQNWLSDQEENVQERPKSNRIDF